MTRPWPRFIHGPTRAYRPFIYKPIVRACDSRCVCVWAGDKGKQRRVSTYLYHLHHLWCAFTWQRSWTRAAGVRRRSIRSTVRSCRRGGAARGWAVDPKWGGTEWERAGYMADIKVPGQMEKKGWRRNTVRGENTPLRGKKMTLVWTCSLTKQRPVDLLEWKTQPPLVADKKLTE